jgi:hypothetical protein
LAFGLGQGGAKKQIDGPALFFGFGVAGTFREGKNDKNPPPPPFTFLYFLTWIPQMFYRVFCRGFFEL